MESINRLFLKYLRREKGITQEQLAGIMRGLSYLSEKKADALKDK